MGENQLTEFRQPVLGAVHKVRQHFYGVESKGKGWKITDIG